MRVLLVEPPIARYDVGTGVVGMAEPLSLECVAASIPEHDVRILDMRIENSLEKTLAEFRPQVVGTGAYTVGVANAKDVARRVKQFGKAVLTIVGGHHATVVPADFNDPAIDVIVVGEGEPALRELVAAFEAGKPFDDIPGLGLRRNGELVFTPERPLCDLDSLAFPARHLVEKYRSHYFRGKWRPIASMYSSRGCPHRCSFCGMWKVNRGKYRTRAPEKVVEELKQIPETFIDLVDDNTFENVKWALELSRLIKAAGIRKRYKVYSRSDTISKHPELIKAWKEIGLDTVLVGFESFRDSELGQWNKRNSIVVNEQALETLRNEEVQVAAYFVISPDYVEKDFADLKKYIDRWGLFHPVFTILTPFPGTDLFDSVRESIRHPEYELFDFFHVVLPTALPEKEFYAEFIGLYKYAYSFGRALKHVGKQKFFGVSYAQLAARKKFFRQLDGLMEMASP